MCTCMFYTPLSTSNGQKKLTESNPFYWMQLLFKTHHRILIL